MPRRNRCRCCGDPVGPGASPSSVAIKVGGDGFPARTVKSWQLCAECVAAVAAAIEAVISAMRMAAG